MSTTVEDVPRYRNPSVLRSLYWGEQMSTSEIADRFGVTGSTIRKWMERHGIERRSRFDAKHTQSIPEIEETAESRTLHHSSPDEGQSPPSDPDHMESVGETAQKRQEGNEQAHILDQFGNVDEITQDLLGHLVQRELVSNGRTVAETAERWLLSTEAVIWLMKFRGVGFAPHSPDKLEGVPMDILGTLSPEPALDFIEESLRAPIHVRE